MLTPARKVDEEEIVPLSFDEGPTIKQVRSTLLASSLRAIRQLGLFEQYESELPPQYHEVVLQTLGATWLPVEAALAHYVALDALGLDKATMTRNGREVGDRVQGSFLGTIARGAKHAGLTPWAILGKADRIWSRVFAGGGGVGVTRLAPKEARVAIRGVPLLRCDCFLHGWRGAFEGGVELVAKKCYATAVRPGADPNQVDYLISWV